jgi:DNA-binding transcriptional LysR family regulator
MAPLCQIRRPARQILSPGRGAGLRDAGVKQRRQFRYSVAIAEEASFTRAAARLRIAQPALSRQIKAMERDIGFAPFLRGVRGITLTEPGRVFIASARVVLAEADVAIQKARRAGRGELGLLRIGFTASASFNPFVTGSIRDFRTAHPDVEVELIEEATSFLLDRFATGRLDVAFLRPAPGEVDHLLAQRAVSEPLVVAMPIGHEGEVQVRVTEVAGQRRLHPASASQRPCAVQQHRVGLPAGGLLAASPAGCAAADLGGQLLQPGLVSRSFQNRWHRLRPTALSTVR